MAEPNITHVFMLIICVALLIGVIGFLIVHIYYKHKTLKKMREIAYLYENYKKEIQDEMKKQLYKKENE